MKKIFLLLVILSIFVAPLAVLAAPTSITQIVNNLATLISNMAIFVTVACWIITGMLFLLAQGDPSKLTKAKTALIWASVGTAVAIISGTATVIINNALTVGG